MQRFAINFSKRIRIYALLQKLYAYSNHFPIIKAILSKVSSINPEERRLRIKKTGFFSKFIKKGDLCFDIGANVGEKTEIFLKIGARVICIEPQNNCVRVLQYLYGKNQNVKIIHAALDEKEGYGEISICEDEPTISTMSSKWEKEGLFSNEYIWARKEKVQTITIDKLINLYGRPIFCKIDVEGYEEKVLKGMTNPIPLLSFEATVGRNTDKFWEDAKKCINYLDTLGLVKYNMSVGNSQKFYFSEWVKSTSLSETIRSLKINPECCDIYAKLPN